MFRAVVTCTFERSCTGTSGIDQVKLVNVLTVTDQGVRNSIQIDTRNFLRVAADDVFH